MLLDSGGGGNILQSVIKKKDCGLADISLMGQSIRFTCKWSRFGSLELHSTLNTAESEHCKVWSRNQSSKLPKEKPTLDFGVNNFY